MPRGSPEVVAQRRRVAALERQLAEQSERLTGEDAASLRESIARFEPLVEGTQLILRKVRHAPTEGRGRALWTLREEVRRTGILDAYRQLLTRSPAVVATPSANDPL